MNWYFIVIFALIQVYRSLAKEVQSSPGEIKFLCTIFPGILKEKCSDYNDNKYENNIKIKVHAEIEISTKSKSIECDICKKVIQEVLNEIGNDHSKGVIRNALEKVCDTLPVLWRSGCKSFVDKYADELVDMIIKNFSVDQICKQIGLCSSNYLVHHSRKSKSIECDICKKIIQEVLNEIGNDHSKGVIRNALEKVCDTLPVLWRSGCKSFVDKYADELVDMIIKNFSVDQICKQIGLCSSNYLVHHSRNFQSNDLLYIL